MKNLHLAALARLVAAALMVWVGWIHLHLYQDGYSHIHVIGPSFLANFAASVAGALALVAAPRRFVAAVAAGDAALMAGTLVALLVSVNFGLFGFKDSLSAPFAHLAVALEAASTVILVALALASRLRGSSASAGHRPLPEAATKVR